MEYYTAEEAMKILKRSKATFYREVERGKIPFDLDEDKQRGRQFPKEAIDALAKAERGTKQLSFKKSTNADLWDRVKNSRRIYGQEDTVSYSRVLEWQKINNNIFRSLKAGNKLVGALTIIPLDEDTIWKIIKEDIREKDIPDDAIKKWSDKNLCAYIPTIAVLPSGDETLDTAYGASLIRHTISWSAELQQNFDIRIWYAIGVTKEGQEIAKMLGFKEIYSNEKGDRIAYSLDRLQAERVKRFRE